MINRREQKRMVEQTKTLQEANQGTLIGVAPTHQGMSGPIYYYLINIAKP